MTLIPAGSFIMGDTFNEGYSEETPTHTVYVSEFYMDTNLVTGALWQQVYDWASNHGYGFEQSATAKAPNHPILDVLWWDAIKWCNARSEKEGLVPCYYLDDSLTTIYRSGRPFTLSNSFVNWRATGYRLPTEAEWEKAARGGTSGLRFPWGNLITHTNANYYSSTIYSYDVSSTRYYHPTFSDGLPPYNYTSPVGYFQPNGYGLYDMAGNVRQWCWDFVLPFYYASSPGSDPHGPDALGSNRALRGGGFYTSAKLVRIASRDSFSPYDIERIGFRCVRAQ